MNMELQNSIRLAMCCGWIVSITKPHKMPELVSSRSQTGGGIKINSCSFLNCGTAVRIDGGHLVMSSSHIENCKNAISASGDAFIDASYMSINKCETVFKEED